MTEEAADSTPALDRPHYGIGPVAAVARFFKKYATFSGRASRSEYWWVVAAFGVLSVPFSFANATVASAGASGTTGSPSAGPPDVLYAVVGVLVALAILVPYLALTVRRLHDANLSGFLCLLNLVPYLGTLMLAAIAIRPPHPLGVRFDAAQPHTRFAPPVA